MSDTVTLSGTVADVFAHRFTLETDTGTVLADLGPKGAERIALATGDAVSITGERKPSEIKVTRLTRGGETLDLSHDKGPDHPPADPKPVLAAVEQAGLTPLGEPRRKPKHFEVLARDADGAHHELHVEFDGTLRQRKPVAADDGKWAEALTVA
jgi:hypothetical protein